jgi:hypothetical protein
LFDDIDDGPLTISDGIGLPESLIELAGFKMLEVTESECELVTGLWRDFRVIPGRWQRAREVFPLRPH